MTTIRILARTFTTLVAFLAASAALALPFNADYRVSTLNSSSQNPRIAGAAGTQNLHLVWVEYPGGTGDASSEIYYARSTNNGLSWDAPLRITNNATADRFPSVAASGNTVMIVWSTDFNTGDIYFSRSSDNGATFSAPAPEWATGGYSRNPEVVAVNSTTFVVTWYDSSASPGVGHIFVQGTCDSGTTWSAVRDLTVGDGEVDNESPALARASDGTVWLTYRSSRNGEPQGGWPPFQQYMARMSNFACPASQFQPGSGAYFLWPPQKVSPGLPDAITAVYGSTLVPGLNGKVHLGYWDNSAGNNITYRNGQATTGWSAPQSLSGLGLNNPQITAGNSDIAGPGIAEDANGKVHVFWWEETGVSEGFKVGNLRYRESLNGGTSFGAATNLTSSSVTMTPKALYHMGRVHVVWADYRNFASTSSEIYHKFANEDGSLNTNPQASLSESAYLFPATPVGSTSAPHAFTLTNVGGAAMTISSISASAEFGQTNNCPGSLAVSAACTINGTFTPALTGLRTGSISITDNAAGSPQVISLSGNGGTGNGDNDDDGVPDTVEPVEGLNPNVKDNDIFAATTKGARLFAMQQYRDFLGREGDAGGIGYWTGQLSGGTQTRAQMIENYFGSDEFQGVGAPVARLYFAYFLRIPDYGGLQYWTGQSRTGHPLSEISQAFSGSQEFVDRYGALNNDQFVDLVYQNVLGRPADAGGKAFWLGQLNGGTTRGSMMIGFSESTEYKGTIYNSVYVTMMYVGMLKRSPDQGGFDFWKGFITAGNSGQTLINGFLSSQEYYKRFLP